MKKVLVLIGILVGLVVLAVIGVILLVDVDAHKPGIETVATEALGMEVKIHGKAGLRLFPSTGISFADVHLRNRGSEVARLGSLRIGVKLLPLLRKQVEVTEFVLEKPDLLIEKEKGGRFNYETPPKAAKPSPAQPGKTAAAVLVVRSSAVEDGHIVYLDRQTGEKTELTGFDLSVTDLSFSGKQGVDLLQTLSFSGNLRVQGMTTGNVSLSDIRAAVTAENGIFRVRPFTMRMFGGSGEGEIDADFSKAASVLKVRYTLRDFRAEEALSAVSRKKYVRGKMTISPTLSFRGTSADAMKRSMGGSVSLRGENLTVQGMDIDAVLSKARDSLRFDLADVGTFLLAGPLGSSVAEGYRPGAGDASSRGKESRVTRLVSEWSVANGVAEARDVAFATTKHRIALTGKIDIVNERFVGITVASLDGKGCATFQQKIAGPFRNPTMDRVSTLRSVAVPLLGLFEKTKKFLPPGECKPFYAGSVAHPD